MKQIFKSAILVISLIAAWYFMSLLPLEDNYTSRAQSAYPYPPSNILPNPFLSLPTAYPNPQETQAAITSSPTSAPELTSISITISVEGLKDGDEAQVSMHPFSEKVEAQVRLNDTELPSISLSKGEQMILAKNIPVGIYKVVIQAPSDYLRNPKGYIIRIPEAPIDQPSNQLIHFSLILSKDENLPPCRNIAITDYIAGNMTNPENTLFVHEDVCMAEGLVDVSNPTAFGQLNSKVLSSDYGNYYYAGPLTTQDNQGVWGRNYVVDPFITHGEGYDQFVAERVYADQGSNWMEAGWTEKSWFDDRQYIYAMDSNLSQSIIFDDYIISPGSGVETRVYYNSEVAKWRATYHLGGGYWVVLREEDIGFSIADNGYNLGEFWENIGVLPLMPPSMFDVGYLLIGGTWRIWDTRYDTDERIDFPYQLDMITRYNHFDIHSPIIFLPLVMKN